MIRDYKQSDIDEIVRIYTLEYKAMPEEIETLKSASKILVFEDNNIIQGFIHMLEQNAAAVNLKELANNDKASKLYINTGFRVVQGQDYRKLILN